MKVTLPKTNHFAPENRPGPKRKGKTRVFLRGELLNFGECTFCFVGAFFRGSGGIFF